MNMTIKIRSEQLLAFEEGVKTRYIRSLAEFIKTTVPEASGDSPEDLIRFVEGMVKRAQSYGMKSHRDAAIYVTTAYLLGENFEKHFRIAEQVLNSALPAAVKAQWLKDAALVLIGSGGEVGA
jgi:hypothetical protein